MTAGAPEGRFARLIESHRTPTHVAGVLLLAVGVLGALTLLAARGASSVWLAQAWTLAVVALVGLAALSLPGDGQSRTERAVLVVTWAVAALVLANTVVAWVDLDAWVWRAPSYFPFTQPIGTDFRGGAYQAAQTFSTATSGWPPLPVVLFQPYLLLAPDTAYVAHLLVMIAMDLGAIGLAVLLGRSIVPQADGDTTERWRRAVGRLGPILAVWLFVSFGFVLSVERGSIDAFVAFFAMAGLASLVRRPHDVWTSTILFSLAANLKIYPAMLLLLVIWRFRWRSVLPIVVVNVLLALIAGPGNLVGFFRNSSSMIQNGASWVGNESAKSFSWWIDQIHPWYMPHVPTAALLAVPAVVFVVTAVLLWRRRDHVSTVLMACATFPVMCLVPSVSHDYKTVILAAPLVLLFAVLMGTMRTRSAEPWWMLLALAVAMFFIGRAPGHLIDYAPPLQRFVWPALLMNKYLPILLLQVVIAWMAWRLPRPTGAAPGGDAAHVTERS